MNKDAYLQLAQSEEKPSLEGAFDGGIHYAYRTIITKPYLSDILTPLLTLAKQCCTYGNYMIRTRHNDNYSMQRIVSWINNGMTDSGRNVPQLFIDTINRSGTSSYTTEFQLNFLKSRTEAIQESFRNNVVDISAMFHFEDLALMDARSHVTAYYVPLEKIIYMTIYSPQIRSFDSNEPWIINLAAVIMLQYQAVLASLNQDIFSPEELTFIENIYNISKEVRAPGSSPRLNAINLQMRRYYLKDGGKTEEEFLTEELAKAAQKAHLKLVSDLTNKLNTLRRDYEDKLMQCDRFATEIQTVLCQIAAPSQTADALMAHLKYLLSIPEIQSVTFSDSGNCLNFNILGPLRVDPKLVDRQYLRSQEAYDFFKGIATGEFKTYCANTIQVGMNPGGGINYTTPLTTPDIPYNQNPHLERFGCMGSNKDQIQRHRNERNWGPVGMQCVETVCQLNLADGAVTSSFIDWYLVSNPTRNPEALQIETKEGTFQTWKAYYAAKQKGGKQSEKVSD